MRNTEINKMLPYILEIMEMMVECGAEIYRIEESATRIFKAYGAKRVDVYATTSNIILSVETEDGIIKTHTRRVLKISYDIEKMHNLNSLVRRVTNEIPDVSVISEEIRKIKSTKNYPYWVGVLFYGIIAAAFYMFFGGRNAVELIISALIGLITGVLSNHFDGKVSNKFTIKFICSFVACMISYGSYKLNIINDVDYIIIGNIMTLIPGVGLTNSLRDLFSGDSISGILRMIEAALLALSIAGGYIVTTFCFGGAI